ncbi:MAG: SAM-dependent methyltransferase [Polyangiales bacterium]
MKSERASVTARFVALCRGIAPLLPAHAQLALDPFGARVLGDRFAALLDAAARAPAPLRAALWGPLLPLLPWAIYMQVRTRAFDDALAEFAGAGGAQVVILGAGFDARADRLGALAGARFFEVDHPATQSEKRARFGATTRATRLPWDFERDATRDLPAALIAAGLDPDAPTFTLLEGVTMYLSRSAFDATLDAVRGYSAPGSRLGFNYVERDLVERPGAGAALVGGFVRAVGEPFRLGLEPDELREDLAARGFAVLWDESFLALTRRLLPAPWGALVRAGRRVAVVERSATAERR